MEYLDKKIARTMKEEIEDSIFADELGQYIDTLADLDTDEDIINDVLGGNEDE